MDDLDRALARLAGAPAPAALEGIEDQVSDESAAAPPCAEPGSGSV